MQSIQELTEKTWYRLVKVIFIVANALVAFVLLFVGLIEFGRDYHPIDYPQDAETAFMDPEFRRLDDDGKRDILKKIDDEFRRLDYSAQKEAVRVLTNDFKGKNNPNNVRYNYTSYYSWNTKNSLIFILIFAILYSLFVETARRLFYYVVLGKLYPPKTRPE